MKSDLIVSEVIGSNLISAARHLPRQLQRLTIQLLQKATRLATYAKLSFDWLVKLVKSNVTDLIQAGLTIWA